MYFDYFTLAALKTELEATLLGGRLQDVLQIDEFALGLEIYAQGTRHYLYLSADPDLPRLYRVGGRLRRGAENPSPLALRLRHSVEGAKLTAIQQPAWERLLRFEWVNAQGTFSLIFEGMERRANLLLVQDDFILECARRVGADENRVRQLLPAHPYQPPPPQDKRPPLPLSEAELYALLEAEPTAKAPQILTGALAGLSPLLAKEICQRATGKPSPLAGEVDSARLHAALQNLVSLLMAGQFEAGILTERDNVLAYAPYRLTQRGTWTGQADMSAALNAFYGDPSGDNAYEAAKKPIRAQLAQAKKKSASRQSGELLLAYQYQLKRGQTSFSAEYDLDGPPLTIALDPALSPLENAQRYFEKYEKAKRARQNLPKLIKEVERALRYLNQLETDLDLATGWGEIGEVQEALQKEGLWRGPKRRPVPAQGRSSPMKLVSSDGMTIWIGRNSRQNEEVTFKRASAEDLWLHARGLPGSHVVIKSGGLPVSAETLELAASAAAYYSKGRHEGAVEVIVTQRRYVTKIKGGKTGMVRLRQQTHPSVRVAPRAPQGAP